MAMTRHPPWQCALPILVLWLALGLRLYHLDFQSIWWDEGHSIFVASHPIRQIPTLPAMDVHPPAYFGLLHLWMNMAGRSEFALRYLSVVFSLLTVTLLWRCADHISHYLVPQSPNLLISQSLSPPFFAALLAALSPMYVAYAQEVRSYALITCLALASSLVLMLLVKPPQRDRDASGQTARTVDVRAREQHRMISGLHKVSLRGRSLLLPVYILLTAACLYTHYFTIFLLLFQNLVWLAWVLLGLSGIRPGRNSPAEASTPKPFIESNSPAEASTPDKVDINLRSIAGRLKIWAVSQGGILLLFTPQLILAWRQVTSYTNPNLVPPSLAYFIGRSWQAYTVGLTIDPTLAHWGMGAIAGALLFGWLICIIRYQVETSANFWRLIIVFTFLLFWLVVPLTAYFVVLQSQPSFEPRYLMLATPALFLLLVIGLEGIKCQVSSVRCQVSGSYAEQPAKASTPSLSKNYVLRFTFYVLCFIPIIIFLIGLHSYYTDETYFKDDSAGVARWLAAETKPDDLVYVDVPHPFHYYVERLNIPAPTRYLFVDIHTAAETLNHEAAGRERLFWVTWWGSDTDPRGVIPFLAEKAGRWAGQQDFKGYHVQWFDLPAGRPAIFSLPNELLPINATFGDVLRLDRLAFGGDKGETTTITEPVWATLHFTLLHEAEIDYKVSLRLRGEDGRVVAQVDRDLLNDRHFRTSAWPLSNPTLNQAINVYLLPLAADTPPGRYRLEAVVYNPEPPYPSEGVTGHDNSDGAAILGYINVVP
jgi:hypothetical protein